MQGYWINWLTRGFPRSFEHLILVKFWQKSLLIIVHHWTVFWYWLFSLLWWENHGGLDPELILQKPFEFLFWVDLILLRKTGCIGLSELFITASGAVDFLLYLCVFILYPWHLNCQRCVPHYTFGALTFAQSIVSYADGWLALVFLDEGFVHCTILFTHFLLGLLEGETVGYRMGFFVCLVTLLIFDRVGYFLFGIDVLNGLEFLFVPFIILLDFVYFHELVAAFHRKGSGRRCR